MKSSNILSKTLLILRRSLILKNIILFITPVSIAVLIFMLFNLSQTVEHLSNSIIKNTTEETVNELNRFFDPATSSLKVAYQWGSASMLQSLEPENLNHQFIPVLKNYSQISSMLIANTKGCEYMLLREKESWVNRIVSFDGTVQNIMRYRWKYDDFMNVLGTEKWKDEKKYDPRVRPWFIGGLNAPSGTMVWTQPYIFFTTKDPGITVSMNWRSNSGDTMRYVIAYDIMLIDISAYTTNLQTGKHGKAFILTSDDKLIGLPKDPRLINSDSLKKYVLNDFKDLNVNELTIAVNAWKEKGKGSEPFKYAIKKDDWWAGFHSFQLGEGNMFYIGVIVPEDDFMSEVNRTRTVIVAGFLLVLVLTLLVIRGYNQKQKAYALLEIQNTQIRQQKEEIETNRDEIAHQRDKIEEQRNEITDSIRYSLRIQTAVMPPESLIKSVLPEHFVFFRPKDIVSGDFYWVHKNEELIMWASVDCTGHGVPGAIMSIIGYNGINRAVREYHLNHPGEILDKLNHIVAETFRQEEIPGDAGSGTEGKIRDGMDISLCTLNQKSKTVEFSGANNPLYLIRPKGSTLIINGKETEADLENETWSLFEIKGDRQPIGSYSNTRKFSNNILNVESGDSLYTFSDGFEDQFGGTSGKKYMSKRFKGFLLEINHMSVEERLKPIEDSFLSWKGDHDQVDDVLIFGVVIQ